MNTNVERIENRLSVLGRLNTVGLSRSSIKNTKDEYLSKLNMITKNLSSYYGIGPFVLRNDKVLNIFNSDYEELKEAYYKILTAKHITDMEIIEKYNDELVLFLYNLKLENDKKEKESRYYRHNWDVFSEIAYIIEYAARNSNVGKVECENIFRNVNYIQDYYDSRNFYEKLNGNEKYKFFTFAQKSFTKRYENQLVDLYKKDNSDLYELMSYMDKYDVNVRIDIEDAAEILQILQEIQNKIGGEYFSSIMQTVFMEENKLNEFKMFCYKVDSKDCKNIDDYYSFMMFLYEEQYPELFKVMANNLDIGEKKLDMIYYALKNKKKAFLKLIVENMDVFSKINSDSEFFSKEFRQKINLNTLNKENLKFVKEHYLYNTHLFNEVPEGYTLTFNEYLLLVEKQYLARDVYFKLNVSRVDDKIKIISEFDKDLDSYGTIDDIKHFIKDKNTDKEVADYVAEVLSIQPLSQWRKDLIPHIQKCDSSTLIKLILNAKTLSKFLPECKDDADIRFLLKIVKDKDILKLENITLAKKAYYSNSEQLKNLLKNMDLSDKFIEENEIGIYNFASRNLIEVVKSLSEGLNSTQRNNLFLLTKATMAGQFEKIKFFGDDLDIEIGTETTETVKTEWRNNLQMKVKSYTIAETYDFETVIRMGQYPTETCMHWGHGSYRECLLSNFDTNKKLLTASINGEIVGRAVIRLTKGTDNVTKVSSNKLGFKDIEQIGNEKQVEVKETNEKLVIFLERPYIARCNDSDKNKILQTFVKTMFEKAKKMGALLVVSSSYNKLFNEDNEKFLNCTSIDYKNYHLFISYSKNGKQYLDSFSGQNEVRNEGKYKSDKFFVIEP